MTRIALLACLLSSAAMTPAFAQLDDLRMPVIIDAERTDYDGRTSMLEFTGLRLTQGDISIEAQRARASRMDFDNSVWEFEGNVVFDIGEGRVICDSASLEFSDFQLVRARIAGSPATFRFRRPDSEETTYAEAARLDYNVPAGIVEFSGGAMINEGGNRIASESLVYSIREQRINAVSAENGEGRVKVIYTPPEPKAGDATGGDAGETQPGEAADEPATQPAPAGGDSDDPEAEPADAGDNGGRIRTDAGEDGSAGE